MKCQILFLEKNKENIINLSSVEFAQRVVKVKHVFKQPPLNIQYMITIKYSFD